MKNRVKFSGIALLLGIGFGIVGPVFGESIKVLSSEEEPTNLKTDTKEKEFVFKDGSKIIVGNGVILGQNKEGTKTTYLGPAPDSQGKIANTLGNWIGYAAGGTENTGGGGTGAGAGQSGGGGVAATADSSKLSGLAIKVAQVAASFPKKYARSGSFKYAAGTQNGNLGCANVVSKALQAAGVKIKGSLAVDGVKSQLKAAGWKVFSPPPYKAGDVIIWKAKPKHKHIGIIARNGNSLMAMNNSSSQKKPIWSSPTHRAVECVLRKA
jgi:hypothetical protein